MISTPSPKPGGEAPAARGGGPRGRPSRRRLESAPQSGFTSVRTFTPLILSGDRWRLAADGNTLGVFLNGVSQFIYTTDGSYPTGDIGIETYTAAFTLVGFEGGSNGPAPPPPPPPDTQPPSAPGMFNAIPAASNQINLTWRAATDNVGLTGYSVERCLGVGCSAFVQVGTTSGTSYNDAGLAANTSYTYRVRATDGAGNAGPYSNSATANTLLF